MIAKQRREHTFKRAYASSFAVSSFKIAFLTWSIDQPLMVAADKYALDSLKTVCESALISEMSMDDVADVLILSDMHG